MSMVMANLLLLAVGNFTELTDSSRMSRMRRHYFKSFAGLHMVGPPPLVIGQGNSSDVEEEGRVCPQRPLEV